MKKEKRGAKEKRMELCGTVKTIIYRSDETGFTVMELVDEQGDETTAVGPFPLVNVGERVSLSGEWTEHRAYGRQFKAESSVTLAPATLHTLVGYLGSGLIKGVGEATAENIVQMFGMDTLDVLENHPERLTEVPGIGRMRAHTIAQSYQEQREMREIMLALQQFGITVAQAMKLYKVYGSLCLAKLQENPYRLIDEVDGFGFKTADKLAQNGGIEADAPYRIRAGLKYTLQWARQEGHTYLPREVLCRAAAQVLGADEGPAERELEELLLSRELVVQQVEGQEAVFLPQFNRMERDLATMLALLRRPPRQNPFFNVGQQIERLEKKWNIQLAAEQRQAVLDALKNGIMVITGGPGTGKTTILRFIISLLDQQEVDYELCAPTGRAAKRMSEATGCEARTIHRLLECGYGEAGFGRNADNPLDAEMVIVDEVSMVDVPLLHALLSACRRETRLVLVGDADQLPPVGPGNVLRDIIRSDTVKVCRLTDIFRQSGRSAIVTNAHRINAGRPPVFGESQEFALEEIRSAEEILRRLAALCSGRAGAGTRKLGTQDPLKDIQVLAPMKKGPLGVKNINLRLQAALNPPQHKKHERVYGETTFREGDKVMQIRNDYRLGWQKTLPGREPELGDGVYNGDLGTVMRIDLYDQTVEVLFDDGRCALYEFSMLDELELAYCISIHKSQGSEFPVVLLPLLGGPPQLMTRNLLYTAVTRARSSVCFLGDPECPARMTANNEVRRRYSALCTMLREQAGLLPC